MDNPKVIFLIIDGLGDRPLSELGDLTPLEYAKTPNLDVIATEGINGLMTTLGRGKVPGSDVAHLTLFGYDIEKYYSGRGPIEIAGLGIKLQHGDVALRSNLGTLDTNSNLIVDRRAGRINDVSGLIKDLDGIEIDGVKFIVKPGTGHRAGVIMRGDGLSANITDADPHIDNVAPAMPKAKDDTKEAQRTVVILSKFIETAHKMLSDSDINRTRAKAGLPIANYLLVRGAGFYKSVPSFESRYSMRACAIAGAGLYKGVGSYLGMDILDVPGATGLPNTSIEAKFNAAKDSLPNYDFIFIHVKAPDSLAEDGNYMGKANFIERIDNAIKILFELKDVLLVITGDHSTPSALKKHSADPVPIVFRGPGVRKDNVTSFGERACAHGGQGYISGIDVMPEVVNLVGLAKLIGA